MADSNHDNWMLVGAMVGPSAYHALSKQAERQGVSVSDIIRDAIEAQYPDVAAVAIPSRKPGRPKGSRNKNTAKVAA